MPETVFPARGVLSLAPIPLAASSSQLLPNAVL